MNYNFATHNEYRISLKGLGPASLSDTEQNSSKIRVSEQNFEQNKLF